MHSGSTKRRAAALIGICATVALAMSCSEGDNSDTESTVNVTLKEFSVTPDRTSANAGHITFDVTNVGEDMHEFLVIKTDLAPDALPTEDDGSYEENGPGTQLLDEIEVIDPGNNAQLSLDLAVGHYVLICNMVHMEDDGEVEVHYARGMHTAFEVN